MSTSAARPVSVTVVAVVVTIQAIIALAIGIGFVVEHNNDSLLEHVDVSSSTVATYGWMAIVWGALALLVAFGLWGGANWSRILVAVIEVMHLAGGVWMLFAWDGHYLWEGVWQIVIALVVLWFLFNPRAEQFFTGRATA